MVESTPSRSPISPSPKATKVYAPRDILFSFSLNQDWEDSFKHDLVAVPLTFWSEEWEIWSSCSMWLVSYNEFSLLVIVSFCHSGVEIQPFSSLSIFLHSQVPSTLPSFESGNSISTDQTWGRTSGCLATSPSVDFRGGSFYMIDYFDDFQNGFITLYSLLSWNVTPFCK